jgi:hypothetical protein
MMMEEGIARMDTFVSCLTDLFAALCTFAFLRRSGTDGSICMSITMVTSQKRRLLRIDNKILIS